MYDNRRNDALDNYYLVLECHPYFVLWVKSYMAYIACMYNTAVVVHTVDRDAGGTADIVTNALWNAIDSTPLHSSAWMSVSVP